jgi:hypothetical protein
LPNLDRGARVSAAEALEMRRDWIVVALFAAGVLANILALWVVVSPSQ